MIPLLTVDNQPDETEMTPASLLFAKPSSQLIRMIASRDDAINKLRTKRNASDEKAATFQAELKKTRHEIHRDKKVSRKLIVDAEREGVEKMTTAVAAIEESQNAIDSIAETEVRLKAEYNQHLREERRATILE